MIDQGDHQQNNLTERRSDSDFYFIILRSSRCPCPCRCRCRYHFSSDRNQPYRPDRRRRHRTTISPTNRTVVILSFLLMTIIHRHRYAITNLFPSSTFSSTLQFPSLPASPSVPVLVSAFSPIRSNTYHHHQRFHHQRRTVVQLLNPSTRYSSSSSSASPSTSKTTSTTSISLFFQNPIDEEEDLIFENNNSAKSSSTSSPRPIVSKETKLGLRSPDISFPFYIQWEEDDTTNDDDDEYEGNGRSTTTPVKSSTEKGQLYIRLMTPNDLDEQIIPICIDEFGTGPTTKLQDFPLLQKLPPFFFRNDGGRYYGTSLNDDMFIDQQHPFSKPTSLSSQISSWWDRLWLEPFVKWALTAKILTSGNRDHQSQSQHIELVDPVLLVLCERRKRPEPKSIFKNKKKMKVEVENTKDEEEEEVIVGMVEISLQPIEYDKNPPAFPVPRWIKEQYSQIKDLGPLEGWVTNLLIPPTSRGKSYSKLLMWATEGIAKKWNCHSIYLHADADIQSGRVPQRLYEGLGYRVVHGNPKTFRGFQQTQRRQRQRQQTSSSPSLTTTANYDEGCDDDDIFAWAADASRIAGLSPFSSSIRMVQGAALLCYCKNLVDIDEDSNDCYSF